jgi:hypothetical protein
MRMALLAQGMGTSITTHTDMAVHCPAQVAPRGSVACWVTW